MDSDCGVDEAVGLWCEVTLVTNAKFDGLVYSYNPQQGLLVLMKELQKKASAKVINTKFIKSFELKEVDHERGDDCLPDQLDAFALLPSMKPAGKPLIKHTTTLLKEAEQIRTETLGPLRTSNACIGAFDVFVKLYRTYHVINWDVETNTIKVSGAVHVEPSPTWENPVAKIKEGEKIKSEIALAERINQYLDPKKGE